MTARPAFNHVGIFVRELAPMMSFYRDALGMVVTDRGKTFDRDVAFLSSDSAHHHQLVLAEGRGQGYVSQPHAERLDLDMSHEEIWAATDAMCRQDPTFKSMQAWDDELALATGRQLQA
ncbi:VOC family protein [Streptomyces sp. NPDC001970]